VASNNSQ